MFRRVPSLIMSGRIFHKIKWNKDYYKGIFVKINQKLVVYYISDYSGISFKLGINTVIREFILWDQRLSQGLFCEKF